MKRFKLNTVLLIITLLVFNFASTAQQFKPNTEVGLILGTSYYLGDLISPLTITVL